MRQLTLRELVHSDDPQSSHDALGRATETRATHCRAVLGVVRECPRMTSAELQRWSPFDLTETRRRLTDLKNQGLVVREDGRKCRVSGKLACTWRAVEKA